MDKVKKNKYGYIDFPEGEEIKQVHLFKYKRKDLLIVFTETQTWELKFKGNKLIKTKTRECSQSGKCSGL